MSKDAEKLLEILKLLFKDSKIESEYHIRYQGQSFFIDFAIHSLGLFFEMDGSQHFKFNSKFHKTRYDFLKGQKKDLLKDEVAKKLNYTIVRFSYKDKLNEQLVLDRIIESIFHA